ncbi:hypothetical protein ONS95_012347 [Cadophora gregata]|uniref:uncharacterized protein n=1 Tax=Cadophora gregata TaxID=51156 RepID=UPI0026DA80CF|nr:uncharacterized protein ONS95_012347 [Cadophora gregata]KAK0118037.1 hypothetical protein ONS95_012347 [Cadophora gregata]KAK0123104.1 hypothetical protein ONS96_010110 [Cadophora gregata f. sp. sojae]
MLKLILPDVGPMPQSTDWLSMTDEQLNAQLVLRGHKPRRHYAQAIQKLVLLEKVELYSWLSAVAEHHGPGHSDLLLLTPVIARRMAMGKEQLRGALVRYEKVVQRKTREVAALEAIVQSLLLLLNALERNLGRASDSTVAENNTALAAGAAERLDLGGDLREFS